MYQKERFDNEAKRRIEDYREAAALFPAVKKVLQAFDGKCLNCRLEKALREATGKHITVNKRFKWVEIDFYPGRAGSYSRTLAQIGIDKFVDGKRIPAELIIESLHKKRVEHLQAAAALERDMDNIELYEQQFEYYKNQIDKLRESLNTETRYIYHLSYYVQNS